VINNIKLILKTYLNKYRDIALWALVVKGPYEEVLWAVG